MGRRHKPSKYEVYHLEVVVVGSNIETLRFRPRMRKLVKSHFKALEICQVEQTSGLSKKGMQRFDKHQSPPPPPAQPNQSSTV